MSRVQDPDFPRLTSAAEASSDPESSKQQTVKYLRKRRLSTPQPPTRPSPTQATTTLTLEDLLPRQATAGEDRPAYLSLGDESVAGSEDDDLDLGQVPGYGFVRPQNYNPAVNNPAVRIVTRRRQQLRNSPNGRLGRHTDRWLDNQNAAPERWRPSALMLYTLAPDQPRSPDTPSQAATTSYLPLYFESNRQTNSRKSSPLVKPIEFRRYLSWQNGASEATSRINTYQWPKGRMPVELFEQITDYLSRDDIKNMRLVNREFEYGVSSVLFKTAVVPFNTEIYDMIESQTTAKPDPKGKGRMRDLEDVLRADDTPGTLHWENRQQDAENKVYKGHGLRVFSGFGPRILKYGMSFEVDEDALSRPPQKKLLEPQVSFWGGYEWPHEQYRRFADRAGLEQAADETSKMKQAFSHLHKVQHLALSVDSGLGWLRGPDASIRSRVFKRPPSVFGDSGRIPDKIEQEQENLWQALLVSNSKSAVSKTSLKTSILCKKEITKRLDELPTIGSSSHANPDDWPLMEDRIIPEAATETMYHNAASTGNAPSSLGVLYALSDGDWERDEMLAFKRYPINPKELTKEQKEWLLETEWAQRAFMMSYMLAVVDNPTIFTRVHTLNLSRISSRYVSLLDRPDFWAAFPQLHRVIINVIPDWRNCSKDTAGFVKTPSIDPSEALVPFHKLLKDQVRKMRSITSLSLGWINGGEHADGIHARNQHLLPAPILLPHNPTSAQKDNVMIFPFVEHLTISNCWITPPAAVAFVEQSRNYSLEKLTFDSVSLTAHPRFPSALDALAHMQFAGQQNGQAQGQNPGPQNLAQGQNPGPPPPLNIQQAHAHFMAQFQAVFQQGNGGLPQNLPLPGNAVPLLQGVQQLLGPQAQMPNQNVPPVLGLPPAFIQMIQNHHQALVQQQQQQLPAPLGLPPHGIHPPGHHPPAQGQNAAVNTNSWASCREDSWPDIINQISPGRTLADLTSNPNSTPVGNDDKSNDNDDDDEASALHELEFISCGYCRLAAPPFDQSVLEPPLLDTSLRDPYFHKRSQALAPYMMSSKDRMLGSIVQYMPESELNALLLCWGMRHGWTDRRRAEEAEFDGFLPGGTGRFSGVVRKDGTTTQTGA